MNVSKILSKLSDPEIDALLLEIGDKDRVRVVKYAAIRPDTKGRMIRRRVFDEEFKSNLLTPALLKLDELRMCAGLAPRYLAEAFRIAGGELRSVTPNLRVDVGKDYTCDSLGKSASRPAVAEYMALSENASAPAAGDTTLAGEISTGGLARAIATYAHTTNTTSFTLQKTFTASSTFSAVQKEALFNAASVGTMFVENTFTSTALAISDQLTVTHTLNI